MRHDGPYGYRRAATVVAVWTTRRASRSGALLGVVFGLYVALQVSAYSATYPTVAARQRFAQSFERNASLAALVGPARRLDTVAGYLSWRLGVLSILGAVWGLLLATRLLRGEEDRGRWELFLAGRTTHRLAAAQAVVGLSVGLGVLWVLTALGTVVEGTRSAIGFSVTSCLFYATAAVASAAMFVSVGVLASELSATSRQANAITATAFGASFLVRMVADSGNGLGWLRWASPLGWVEELRPLIASQPLALVPIAVLMAGAFTISLVIAGRRDLGASLLITRDVATARTQLLSGPGGLAVRVGRGVALGWVAGLATLGLVMGLVAESASKAISGSKAIEEAIARLGGHRAGAESYLGVAFLTAGVMVTFAAAGQVAAIRNEEADGYVDHLFARPVGRARWLADRFVIAAVVVVVASVATAVTSWVGTIAQHSPVSFGALAAAGLNIAAPALFVLGIGVLIFGVSPRLVSPVVYGLVAWSFIIEIIGSSMNASHWLLDTAVLSHIVPAPAADPNWIAVAWLAGLGIVGAVIGSVAFSRRDLASG